jgi:hypothetical protein
VPTILVQLGWIQQSEVTVVTQLLGGVLWAIGWLDRMIRGSVKEIAEEVKK